MLSSCNSKPRWSREAVFHSHINRVRKYAKFDIFYAKIVQMTPPRLRRESLRLQEFLATNREPLRLQKFSVRNTVLSLPFSQQIQLTLIVNVVNLNLIIEIEEIYCATKQEEKKLQSKFTRWPPSWIWAFQDSRPLQLLRVSLTIAYACQDHVLESLKMSFFVVILDSKYSKMTPKFVKQKSHWLHSSMKFANPASSYFCWGF